MSFLKNNRASSLLATLLLNSVFLSACSAIETSVPPTPALTQEEPPLPPQTDPLTPASSENNSCNKLTGALQIVGRQLLIDGKPFFMKSVCYSPVRKGGNYPEGLITINPTSEDMITIERDFQMMHDAGVNTLRTYEPLLDKRILDLLTKYEFRTIVPVMNYYNTSLLKIISILSQLKDHPSTLIWEVGNEWNYNFFYSKNVQDPDSNILRCKNIQDCILLIKSVILYVRTMDTTHPISTVFGDLPEESSNQDFWSSVLDLDVDIYGTNVYDDLSFGSRFARWKLISPKPLYLAEFGADAYNSLIHREDDASQAIATRSLFTEIKNNLSSTNPDNVLIGASIFEWNDEWWKSNNPNSSPETHDTDGITSPTGKGPYPDHVFNEEWWGIVDIDRNPRPAYDVVKEFYSSPY